MQQRPSCASPPATTRGLTSDRRLKNVTLARGCSARLTRRRPGPAQAKGAQVDENADAEANAVTDKAAIVLDDLMDTQTQLWCEAHLGWEVVDHALRCPAHEVLTPWLRQVDGTIIARFRARTSACQSCELLSDCAPRATSTSYRKEVNIKVSDGEMRPRLRLPSVRDTLQEQPLLPPLLPDAPTLVSSVLRRTAVGHLATCRVAVIAPPVGPHDQDIGEHIALDQETRQRRRQTIAQRVAANARSKEAAAAVTLRVSGECAKALARLKLASRSA